MPVNLSTYKSVLCLDGDLPINFLQKTQLPIIATDGAANVLITNGITPVVIIGDMDSIKIELLKQYPFIQNKNQDTTDFEKALHYLNKKNKLPPIITGISGGFLDRIFENLSIFSKINALFLSEQLLGFPLSKDCILNLPTNTKISLFGSPHAIVTSKGLKWELNKTQLQFGTFNSCSNRVRSKKIFLKIQGRILVFIYRNPIIDAGSNL